MPTPTNILFITDDQHRYDYVSMAERFPARTPNIARLAREGVWHRMAFSPCPLCMPARCSLHTGLYAHQHGMNRNMGHWSMSLPTLPQAMQRLGYQTAAVGKLHAYEGVPERLDLTCPDIEASIRRLGYDHLHEVSGKALAWTLSCNWTQHLERHGLLARYRAEIDLRRDIEHRPGLVPFRFGEEHYMDAYIGDHCVDYLQQVPADRPFFMWAGLVSPHPPYDAPESLLAHFPVADQPLPIDNAAPGDWQLRRSHYGAMVEMVDRQIGRMLDVLEARGLMDTTLIVFTSDHGEMLGDHGMDGKCIPYDPSVRVPLVARWPGVIAPGSVSDAPVELTDLLATFLEVAAGVEDTRAHLPCSPARSLLPLWDGRAGRIRDFIYSEDGGQFLPAYQMIRTPEWKYALYVNDDRELLFDMVADPDECTNLAASTAHAGIRETLKRQLIAHIANTPPPVRD